MKEPVNPEKCEYAACWLNAPKTKILKVSESAGRDYVSPKKEKRWDPLDAIPPIYTPAPATPNIPVVPTPPASAPHSTTSAPTNPADPVQHHFPISTTILPSLSPDGKPPVMLNPYPKSDGPYLNTQGRKALEQMNGLEGDRNSVISMFPLREVPMGGVHGGIGYVNAPLTSTEVRGFKTEMKGLLEDPIGLAKQFEQFLGPNIYTWEELDSILRSLFSSKERQMIRLAGMQIWERENQQGPPGENEMPIAPSQWNPNDKRGRREMNDYRNLITKGIREAGPQGSNIR